VHADFVEKGMKNGLITLFWMCSCIFVKNQIEK
jgi:hypothetical protein